MAIAVIQRATPGIDTFTNGFAHAPFVSNNTAGNTIIALCCYANGSNNLAAITDTAGNTYTKVYDQVSAADSLGMFAYVATSITGGANTVEEINDSFNTCVIFAWEVSGISGSLDKSAQQWQTTATNLSSTATSTTTNANELLIGAFCDSQNGTGPTYTLGAAWSNLQTGYVSFCLSMAEEQIVSSTGAYTATATISTNPNNFTMGAVLTFPASGGGGSSSTPRLLSMMGVGR